MSPVASQPRPEARPEPGPAEQRALSDRERLFLLRAAYPLNRGLPHFVDFPADR